MQILKPITSEFCTYSSSQEFIPREVEEESCSAEPAHYHVGRLDCKEDHEETAGDGAGGDHRLEIRGEPFG